MSFPDHTTSAPCAKSSAAGRNAGAVHGAAPAPAILLRDVSVTAGGRTLLRDASATFAPGELVALIGRNGAGKSTLLRSIAGLHKGFSGTIALMGDPAPTPARRAHAMAYVATGRIRLQSMRVSELVALGRAPLTGWAGRLSATDREAIDRAMDMTGVTPMANRAIDTLSDGEAQRVMIARAIAQDTPIIMLDEPTSYLDIPARVELCRLLRSLADNGRCILFTTHELDLASTYSSTIALIHDSSLLTGSPDSMATAISSAFSL